jgi:hypothetical protein
MAFSITTLSIMPIIIMDLFVTSGIMTLTIIKINIMDLIVTFNVTTLSITILEQALDAIILSVAFYLLLCSVSL